MLVVVKISLNPAFSLPPHAANWFRSLCSGGDAREHAGDEARESTRNPDGWRGLGFVIEAQAFI